MKKRKHQREVKSFFAINSPCLSFPSFSLRFHFVLKKKQNRWARSWTTRSAKTKRKSLQTKPILRYSKSVQQTAVLGRDWLAFGPPFFFFSLCCPTKKNFDKKKKKNETVSKKKTRALVYSTVFVSLWKSVIPCSYLIQ